VSEWELRERREPEEERREEAEALGADDVLGAGGEPRCSFPPPRSWHRQARSRERATFSFVGIYGSIKGEDCELIVLQHYTGARSLYIQEGHRDKGRKTTPPSRCSGTQSCPDATSGPSSPDAHYSDIFFFFCSFLCDLPWCVSTLSRDRARRKAKGSLQRPASRGLRAENLGKMYAAIVEKGCMRVGINKKRKPGYERSAHAPSRGWHAARSKWERRRPSVLPRLWRKGREWWDARRRKEWVWLKTDIIISMLSACRRFYISTTHVHGSFGKCSHAAAMRTSPAIVRWLCGHRSGTEWGSSWHPARH